MIYCPRGYIEAHWFSQSTHAICFNGRHLVSHINTMHKSNRISILYSNIDVKGRAYIINDIKGVHAAMLTIESKHAKYKLGETSAE